jgi:hypothetical protein
MKTLALVALLTVFSMAALAQDSIPISISIPQGTRIMARLASELDSGQVKVGDLVTMDVLEDLKIENVIAIPKGSVVMGHVAMAKGARKMGRGGNLDVTFETVTAGDGTKVPISGEADAKGKGGYGGGSLVAAGAAGFFFPPAAALLLLKHGHASVIPVGSILTVRVTADTVVAGTHAAVAIIAPPASVVPTTPKMVVVSSDPEAESLGNYARRLKAEKDAKQ